MNRNPVIILLSLLFSFSGAYAQQRTSLVGVINDTYDVNALGAYNHVIPLEVPPGINGLVPGISLVYDSRSGISDLGYGWALSGLSTIRRAGNNIAQNGITDGITFSSRDAFLLDGQYLTCIDKTNGSANSVYRTENESFAVIRAVGSVAQSTSSPENFVVKYPNGLTYYYGTTEHSRLQLRVSTNQREVMEWHVSRIEDAHKNYISFEYSLQPSNTVRIESISYTGNARLSIEPANKILFNYDPVARSKKKVNTFFVAGSSFKADEVLSSIQMETKGRSHKYYFLQYDTSTYKHLVSIKECIDPAGKSCIPETTIGWNTDKNVWYAKEKTVTFPAALSDSAFLLDLDGDAIEEFITLQKKKVSGKDSIVMNVFTRNENAFSIKQMDFPIGEALIPAIQLPFRTIKFPDLNGDGLPDMVTGNYVFINNSTRGRISFKKNLCYSCQPWRFIDFRNNPEKEIVDINGDGKQELLVKTWTQSGIYGLDANNKFKLLDSFLVAGNPSVVDFSAAGKSQVLFLKNGGNGVTIKKWNGNKIDSFSSVLPTNIYGVFASFNYRDLNGDGYSDAFTDFPGLPMEAWLFDGKSYTSTKALRPLPVLASTVKKGFGYFTSTEFLQYIVVQPDNKVTVYDIIAIGRDSLQFLPSPLRPNFPAGLDLHKDWAKVSFEDFDWDGIPDLVVRDNKTEVRYRNSLSGFNKIDDVTDGMGNYVSISYTGLKDGKVYTPLYDNDLKSNYRYYKGAYPVVSSIEYNTGFADEYEEVNYTYEGLVVETTGRGLAGFRSVTKKQENANITTTTEYEYEFPLTGRLLKEKKWAKDKLIFEQTNKWGLKLYAKGEDYERSLGAGIAAPAAIKSAIGDGNGQSTTKALQLVSKYQRDVDIATLSADKQVNRRDETHKLHTVLKSIKNFSGSQLTYKQLLLATKITKFELDGTEVSGMNITNRYDDYGNNIYSAMKFSDGTTHITERRFSNINDDLSVSAVYMIGMPVSESSYVKSTTTGQETGKRIFDYEYNTSTGDIVKKIRQKGDALLQHTTEFGYDGCGNIISKKVYRDAADVLEEKYLFTDDYRFVRSYVNAAGMTTAYTYDAHTGNLTSETDANNFTMQFRYDRGGNLISERYPDGKLTEYSYQLSNDELFDSEYIPYSITTKVAGAKDITRYYDQKGRETFSLSPLLDEPVALTGQVKQKVSVAGRLYHSSGQIAAAIKPFYATVVTSPNEDGDIVRRFESRVPDTYMTVYELDALNRVEKIIYPDSNSFSISYSGLTKYQKDAKGDIKATVYNTKGQITEVRDAAGVKVQYEYDLWGNLTKITSPGTAISMQYDLIGRKVQLIDPNVGTVRYTYDAFDRLTAETTNGTRSISLGYDRLGRLVKKTTPEGATRWYYDGVIKGKLDSITDVHGNSTAYNYDSWGRPVTLIQKIRNEVYVSTLKYDSLSRIQSKTYPSGLELLYEYRNNVPVAVSSKLPGKAATQLWTTEQITATGLLSKGRFGNGVVLENTYAVANDMLQRIRSTSTIMQGAAPVQDIAYEYDRSYRITRKNDAVYNISENYEYDALSRLSLYSKTKDGRQTNDQFEYSNTGNITQRSSVGAFQYDQNANQRVKFIYNQGTKVHEYQYDAYGNLTGDAVNGLSIQYSSFNKPAIIRSQNNSYSITHGWNQSELLNVFATGTDTMVVRKKPFADFEVVRQKNISNAHHYIFCGGVLVAIQTISDSAGMRSSSLSYVHRDHQGSVYGLTDSSGQATIAYHYDPFGKREVLPVYYFNRWGQRLQGDSVSVVSKGYTNHEHVEEFGLINAGGRYYDPQLGRFMSPDPFIQDPSASQSLNRYSYVMNDPVNSWDPEGFWSISKPLDFSNESRAAGRAFNNLGRELGNAAEKFAQFHRDVYREGDRFLDKYGQQVAIIAAAAVITYFTAGSGTAAFLAAVGKGAAIGAGIGGGMAAVRGGNFKEIMDASLTGAMNGAASASMFYAVGSGFEKLGKMGYESNFGSSGFVAKTAAHGVAGGVGSELSGGSFKQGFIEASVVHALSPVNEQIFGVSRENKFHRIGFAAGVGALAGYASGGNVMTGTVTGGFSRWFNCESHLPPTDNSLYKFLDEGYCAWKLEQKAGDPFTRAGRLDFDQWDNVGEFRDSFFLIYEVLRKNGQQKQQPAPQPVNPQVH